ncbi:helix-turn-helix transcriptional regulator [Streptomyces sp. NBC_00287]|uniref:helix-turn-helix transcriptional regulator n=1 Tax=Streptomyces sp. NBC_00287 TaxID=2975702 RepID=UPI003FA76C7B
MHLHLRLSSAENRERITAELTGERWIFCDSLECKEDRHAVIADQVELSEIFKTFSTRPMLIFVCSDAADPMIPDALPWHPAGLIASTDVTGAWETAIREVDSGGNWISPVVATRFLEPCRPPWGTIKITGADQLTPAQRAIITFMITGMTRTEVAVKLSIQESTVAYHIRRGLQRLGCANIRELQAHIIRQVFDNRKLHPRQSGDRVPVGESDGCESIWG